MSQQPGERVVESQFMYRGDRIVVEPGEGEEFVAEVLDCRGWSLVHGVMDWVIQRVDGEHETFTYGIHVNAPVRVMPKPAKPEGDQSE